MTDRKPYEPPAIRVTWHIISPPRKPYTPPAVLESGRFERLILGCSHTTAMPGCNLFGNTPNS
jgi:hypothetical protein